MKSFCPSIIVARVAQSVERVAFNHNVQGSSPCSGVTYVFFFFFLFFCFLSDQQNYSYTDDHLICRQFISNEKRRGAREKEEERWRVVIVLSSSFPFSCVFFLLLLLLLCYSKANQKHKRHFFLSLSQ